MFKKFISRCIDIIPFSIRKNVKNIPLLNWVQKSIFQIVFKNSAFKFSIKSGPAKGLVFPIQMPDDKNIWIGNYELEFTDALLAQMNNKTIFYDIGGFKGYFGGLVAIHGAAKSYIFEPLPSNIQLIKKLISLNPTLPIFLEETAISNTVGNTNFNIMPDASMGKLEVSKFHPTEHGNLIEVKLNSLDNLVFSENFTPPTLIKIDVEGAENLVLGGASKTIEKFHPTFLIEIHSKEIGKECFDILREYDYSIEVVETKKAPDFVSEQEVCHYLCKH